ncbi:MAG: ABC transporter permease [Bacteroidia bacterium]|nr:ABC transporter permease [Bacteroidia bacterium]
MHRTSRISILLVTLLFLYLPVLVLVIYSFNDARLSMQWSGFTLRWYGELFSSREHVRAILNTLTVSLTSTLVATVLGTLLAWGLYRYQFRGKRWLETLVYLPVVIPDILMAVALLLFYAVLQARLGKTTIILSHISFQVSFVVLTVRGRLLHFPYELVEAARDLGAGVWATLREVYWPLLRPGILSGAALAFSLSVDDFIITYFTAGGGDSTLPVYIYSMIRRGVTPEINALSTLMLVVSFLALWASARYVRRQAAGR